MARGTPFRVFGSLRAGSAELDEAVRARVARRLEPDQHSRRRSPLPPSNGRAAGAGAVHRHLPLGPLAVPPVEPGTQRRLKYDVGLLH